MSSTLDISNYEFCRIKWSKFEISMVYPSGCRDIQIRKFASVAKIQYFSCDTEILYVVTSHLQSYSEKTILFVICDQIN